MLVKYYAPVACIGHALHSSRHMLIPLSYKRVHDCSLLASFDIIFWSISFVRSPRILYSSTASLERGGNWGQSIIIIKKNNNNNKQWRDIWHSFVIEMMVFNIFFPDLFKIIIFSLSLISSRENIHWRVDRMGFRKIGCRKLFTCERLCEG